MSASWIFGREQEIGYLEDCLRQRRHLLVHGPAGVGKTLLLTSIIRKMPEVLYCADSATVHAVFRSLAASLVGSGPVRNKSAVALKGIVLERLRAGRYLVVLDHLNRPSSSFAAGVREITGRASTPVAAIARSAHMEDCGYLLPLFPNRADKFPLSNFHAPEAKAFVAEVMRRAGLSATNLGDFAQKVTAASKGNPGAIIAMVALAKQAKYRAGEHIKITPLYIDFCMAGRG